MLILINTNIVNRVLDLIEKNFFSLGDGIGRNVKVFGADKFISTY